MKTLLKLSAAAVMTMYAGVATLSAQDNTYDWFPANNPGFVQFNSDAGTGVSTNKFYTHAVNFAPDGPDFYLNDVKFVTRVSGTSDMTGYDGKTYGWAGFPNSSWSSDEWWGNFDHLIDSRPPNKVYDMLFNINSGDPHIGVMKLTGLKPGAWYEMSFFIHNYAGNSRWMYLIYDYGSPNPKMLSYDQDPYDTPFDRLAVFRYQADAKGETAIYQSAWAEDEENAFCIAGMMNEELYVALCAVSGVTEDSATVAARFSPAYVANLTAVTAWWAPAAGGFDGSSTSIGDWSLAADSDSLAPTPTGAFTYSVGALNLLGDMNYVFRFRFQYGDGSEKWSDVVKFKTSGPTPIVRATAATGVTQTGAKANGFLDWSGSENDPADVYICWGPASAGGAPETWGGAAQAPATLVDGAFDFTLSGLALSTSYKYCFVASNSTHHAWSDTVAFLTPGMEFYWNNNAANGLWADPGNWELPGGAPAGDYPKLPGETANIGINNANITVAPAVSVSFLNVTATGVVLDGAGNLAFDNGPDTAMLACRDTTFNVALTLASKLDVAITGGPLTIAGDVVNNVPGGGFNVTGGLLNWTPPAGGAVFGGDVVGSGTFTKGGADDLTLSGANSFGIGTTGGRQGLLWDGTLAFDGGTMSFIGGGQLFAGEGGTVVFAGGSETKATGTFDIGHLNWPDPTYANTLLITGSGTTWGTANVNVNHRGVLRVCDGAEMSLNNFGVWAPSGPADSPALEISGGGIVTANGFRAGCNGVDNTRTLVTGSGSLFETKGGNLLVSCFFDWADTSSTGHGMIVADGAEVKAADLYLAANDWNADRIENCRNSVTADGGTLSVSGYATIGASFGGNNRVWCYDNFIRVTGTENAPGLMTVGISMHIAHNFDWGELYAYDNYVEAAEYGTIDVDGMIQVGVLPYWGYSDLGGWWDNWYHDFEGINTTNNFLRTSGGGEIKCGELVVSKRNGLSPVLGARASGEHALGARASGEHAMGVITVAGTAEIHENTFVRPVAEKGAAAGRFEILRAGTLDVGTIDSANPTGNIKLADDIGGDGMWALHVRGNSLWLVHSYPATIIMVR